MATTRKRNGRWSILFRDRHGRYVERATKALTLTEAKRLASEAERRERRIELGIEEAGDVRMSFQQLAEKYAKDVVPNHADPVSTLGQINKHLVPALGKKWLTQVMPGDIQALLTSKRETLSPATREKLRIRLGAMFEYARKQLRAFRGENPAKLVARVKIAEERPRYLELEWVGRILGAADEPTLLATAFMTGLRKGELCGLRAEDVQLVRRTLWVRRSYDGATKGRRERAVPIPEALVPFLEMALADAERVGSPWLFSDAEGLMRTEHWDAARAFRTALKKAKLVSGYRHICRRKGCEFEETRKDDAVSQCPTCSFTLWVEPVPMDFTLKHARSTWGTWAYQSTGDIRFVQNVLGHQDVSITTKHYAHALEAHRLQQANRLPWVSAKDLPTSKIQDQQPLTSTNKDASGKDPK